MELVGFQVKTRILRPHGISSLTVSSSETEEVRCLHKSCPWASSTYSTNKSIGQEEKQDLVLCVLLSSSKNVPAVASTDTIATEPNPLMQLKVTQ